MIAEVSEIQAHVKSEMRIFFLTAIVLSVTWTDANIINKRADVNINTCNDSTSRNISNTIHSSVGDTLPSWNPSGISSSSVESHLFVSHFLAG